LAAAAYDIAVRYSDRTFSKTKWLDAEQLAGKIDKTVELGLRLAEPMVAVTRNGKDVGDTANVGFIEPSTHEQIGSVRSGEAALLEDGAYDIRADLFGAEGWLRGAQLDGKRSLTIELKPLKVETLKVDGPAPTACAIEVYGVNFDFDKSALRPDSEPILKQAVNLFKRTSSDAARKRSATSGAKPWSRSRRREPKPAMRDLMWAALCRASSRPCYRRTL
jgi:outer membrane protein OmpA-like peptidoglycan-associated protein